MCMACIQDPVAFREFIRDRLYASYAEPDLVRDKNDIQNYVDSITYLIENPDEHDFTDEQMAHFTILLDSLVNAKTEEDKEVAIEAIKEAMNNRMEQTLTELMTFENDPLAGPTSDDIATDQVEFLTDNRPDALIRAIQHLYYYHETRPEFMSLLFGQDFINTIGRRMNLYAGGAMKGMEEFATVLLVLNEEAARHALAQIMTGVYLEALIAGYYAGAKGQDCLMWMSHELGAVGRQDDRPLDEKMPEVLGKYLEHLANEFMDQNKEEKDPE